MTEPPFSPLDSDKLDFSQFHPIDHLPFSERCKSLYPKGLKAGIHHIRMAWDIKWRDDYWQGKFLCHLGLHRYQKVWYRRSVEEPWKTSIDCRGCYKPQP